MKIIVNDQLIARRARLGKIFTFAGLGLLLVGLIISLIMAQTISFLVSLGCLLGGYHRLEYRHGQYESLGPGAPG